MKPEKNDKIEQADIKHKHTRGPFQTYRNMCIGRRFIAFTTFSAILFVWHRLFLCIIRRALSDDNARMLVHALVCSHVDYRNSILHCVAAVHLHPFQSVLNAAARLIVRKRNFDRITPTLRDNLHWLPVDKRIEFKLCLLVFKCQHQMAPPYLASICVQLSADTRSRQLRSAARNDLLIPRTRTASYGPRSFAVSGPTCWNSLPPQLKLSASSTLQQFCDRLKTVGLLFSRSYLKLRNYETLLPIEFHST